MSELPTTIERPVASRAAAAAATAALADAAGLRLDAYRPEHVAECIRRALAREHAGHTIALARLLREDPAARARFRRSVAVSVTAMFRDPEQFEALETQLAQVPAEARLRVWSAGCSNGAELYSVGVLLARHDLLNRAHLLGSDVLAENIDAARSGAPASAQTPADLRRQTRWEVRDVVADDPPRGSWQIVLCRNLAIYLTRPAKEALHERLALALAPGGLLVLGRSESLLDARRHGLEPVAPHIYRRAV